jgi:hypothetical protein
VKFADCFLAVLIGSISTPAAAAFKISDARSGALASAGAALHGDVTGWSNPAALAFLENPGISLQAENPWCIPELGAGGLTLCMPVSAGTFVLSYSRCGYEAFHESRAGISYGRSLGKKIKAGMRIDYRRIKQYADYGTLYALIPSLGLQVIPVPELTLGILVSNPAGQGYNPPGYLKIPTLVNVGLAYQPEPEILFCIDMNSESGCRPVYCGGMEYTFENRFMLRVGLSSSRSSQYSLGIGYVCKHMKTDFAVSHHPVLGFSPIITLTFF